VAEPFRVGAVVANLDNPAVFEMVQGMESQIANYPNLELAVQDSRNVEDQISKAETLLAQGVNVLGLHLYDPMVSINLIRDAAKQGVAVVILIDEVPGVIEEGSAKAFIAGDEVLGGRTLGEWLVTNFPDGGEAAILTGNPGNLTAEARTTGFKAGLADSNWNVVAEQTANWVRDQGLVAFTDMLTANPNLAAVFANNDEMALGAIQAILAAGKQPYDFLTGEGDIVVLGYNGTCVGLKATYDGDFSAEAILPFKAAGAAFADLAAQFAAGESIDPLITVEIPVLDASQFHEVVEGTMTVDPAIKANIDIAVGSGCG